MAPSHQLEVPSPAPHHKGGTDPPPSPAITLPSSPSKDPSLATPVSPGPICPAAFSLGLSDVPWTPPSWFAFYLPDPWKLELLTQPQGFNYSHADEPQISIPSLISNHHLPSPTGWLTRASDSTPAT